MIYYCCVLEGFHGSLLNGFALALRIIFESHIASHVVAFLMTRYVNLEFPLPRDLSLGTKPFHSIRL